MSIKIKPLRKFTTGTPTTSNMEVGEIAVNTADKKIYMRDDSGGAGSIVEVGASSELFTSGATTNIDINGRVTADEFRFKDSNTLLVSADYTGSSYLVQNEIQEILSITPDGNSQNYSIFGTISAASGANVHTLHINANLRSNTLPDLQFTQTYNEDLSVANTRYITPILFTKETTTASMKLCVKIEAQIFGIVTANLVIIARSNDQLDNVTVNTTEASEFTGTPTGFTERSFTRTYVVNAGSYELQSSNATKIKADSSGVTTTGRMKTNSGALGGSAGDTVELLDLNSTVSNGSRLRVFSERDTAGTDWTTSFTRIQQIIDVTEMSYIQFNGTGKTYGMEFGTNGDELYQKNVRNGQVELYYNNNKKFETTNTGITVTGTLNGHTIPGGSGTLALTSQLPSTALDDITAGDAAVNLTTTTGNITIDAQEGDADIIFKGTDNTTDITALTLDMSEGGKAIFGGQASFGAELIVDMPHGGTYTKPAQFLVNDMGNNDRAQFTFGKALSSSNLIEFGYRHDSNGSASNVLSIGFYGSSLRTIQNPAGQVAFGYTDSSPTFNERININGNIWLDGSIVFEGATADAYETTLAVTDPTGSDKTITLPNATGTVITTGNADTPATASSSAEVDHVLVNDGGVLKKATVSNLGVTASSLAADDLTTGDAAINLTTSTGNITIDAQGNDTDIIFKGTDNNIDITALTLDMSESGKAIFNAGAEFGGFGGGSFFSVRGTAEFRTTGADILIRANSGLTRAELHYDGSERLNTTTDGVEVFGSILSNATLNKYGSTSTPITFTVKVATQNSEHPYNGDGSTNKYVIDGVQGAALTLHGADSTTANSEYIYRFDQSDSSNANHPLRFYYEADKTTAYTTGVTTNGTPGQSGAYTQIAVDRLTPKTLYYQCSQHAYMGNYVTVSNSDNFGKADVRLETGSDIIFQNLSGGKQTNLAFEAPSSSSTVTVPAGAGGTILTTGNSDLPTTTTSSGDADFVLIDDGGTMKKITPANLGIGGGGGGSTAADDITTGDAAVTIATTTGNITIDAQGSDTDIIFKGTDGSSDVTALTLDMSNGYGGDATFNSHIFLKDNRYIGLGSTALNANSSLYDLRLRTDGTRGFIEAMNTDSGNGLTFKATDYIFMNRTETATYATLEAEGALKLLSTDAGATANPVLTLDRNSASPTSGDVLGEVQFKGRNSAGEEITYGSMGVKIEDSADATEDSRLIYKIQKAGELKTVLDIKANQFKVNNVSEVFFGDPISALKFEGATGDAYELTLAITDPTGSDKTVTIPDATGTILTTGNSDEPVTTTSSADADFVLIDDGGTMKKITPANLGIGGGGGGSNQNAYSKFNVAGQSSVEADAVQDDVTFVGAGGIGITTNASTDTITFTGSDGGNSLTLVSNGGGTLNLQNGATSVFDGNVLGTIQFNAPNESSGTDANEIAAAIVAEADNQFSSSFNSTDLVFKLGVSGPATEKMRLTHEGGLTLNNAYTLPTSDGSPNQVLKTDGSGNLSFTTVSGVGSGVSEAQAIAFAVALG